MAGRVAVLHAGWPGRRRSKGRRRCAGRGRYSGPALRLVQFLRPLLRQLLLVFPGDLAAGVYAKGAPFPGAKMAVLGALAFFAAAASSVVSGWLSDRWIAAGATTTRVRKTFTGAGLALATIILPVSVVRSDRTAMVLLMLACAFIGMWSSNLWAITQTLAGPRAAGKWCAMQNGVGNLAGVAAPWVTGWVVQRTGQFYFAFLVAAMVALAGSAITIFGIGPVEQVKFRRRGYGQRLPAQTPPR